MGSGRAWTEPESWLRTGKGMTPTGGAHLSVVEEKKKGGAGPDWAGRREMGRRGSLAAEKEKRWKWAGRAGIKGRKKKRLCIFETNSNNSIQTQIQGIQI